MKPLTKILLTISTCLLFLGAVAVVAGFVVGGMSLGKLDVDTTYEENYFVSSLNDIETVSLIIDNHDVVLTQSASVDELSITYLENEYDLFDSYSYKGTLYFTNKMSLNFLRRAYCALFDKKNKTEKTVVVTVPESFNKKLIIDSGKGSVSVKNIEMLDRIEIETKNADITVDDSNCTKLIASTKTGVVNINGGVFETIDVTVSNAGKYVTVKDTEPEETPEATPDETPASTPEETTDPEATPDAEETPDPDATPEETPEPTEEPKILVIEKEMLIDSADFINLKITSYNTNIKCNFVRSDNFYDVDLHGNTENSNISEKVLYSAQGTIDINRSNGSIEAYFKP